MNPGRGKSTLQSTLGSAWLSPVWSPLTVGQVPVFVLHRFAMPELGVPGHDLRSLRHTLERLRRERYNLLSLSDVVRRLRTGESLPRRGVVFTVDDGYADFAAVGAEIFLAYDCPVTVFLTTGFVDGTCWMWWDQIAYIFAASRLRSFSVSFGGSVRTIDIPPPPGRDLAAHRLAVSCTSLPTADRRRFIGDLAAAAEVELPDRPPGRYGPVTWDDALRLERRGATFGAHSVTHPVLIHSDDRESSFEIEESWRVVCGRLANPVPVFAYPNGDHSIREMRTVNRLGLLGAVSCVQEYASPKTAADDLGGLARIPRFAYPETPEAVCLTASGFGRVAAAARLRRRDRTRAAAREHVSSGSSRVQLCTGLNGERLALEREVIAAGLDIPVVHRAAWAGRESEAASWLLVARGAGGEAECVLGIRITSSRALSGHLIWRTVRFGQARSDRAREDALSTLVNLARLMPRVLRVYVEIFSEDEELRRVTGAEAAAFGFRRSPSPRCYSSTLILDLTPAEEDLLASFHPTARRHIRAVGKNPVALGVIDDPVFADRLGELLHETMARTNGRAEPHEWKRIIDFSRREPGASRLIGLFRTDLDGPPALLAFAWGQNHGGVVEYATAGSTRDTKLKMPLAYALAWDLMRWGKEVGATRFDFGGISPGSHGEAGDPLGGISDFKRYFTRAEARVGEEWIFEPDRLRTAVARAVGAGGALLARVGR